LKSVSDYFVNNQYRALLFLCDLGVSVVRFEFDAFGRTTLSGGRNLPHPQPPPRIQGGGFKTVHDLL